MYIDSYSSCIDCCCCGSSFLSYFSVVYGLNCCCCGFCCCGFCIVGLDGMGSRLSINSGSGCGDCPARRLYYEL